VSDRIKTFLEFWTGHFTLWVILFGLLAYRFPGPVFSLKGYLDHFFALTMFGIGAALRPADFVNIARSPGAVAVGSAAQYTIMPFSAWAIARILRLPDELAIGLVLTGAAPGAMASNVVSFLAKADTAYSVSLTTVSTLLCPVLTPLLVLKLAGAEMDVEYWQMFLKLLLTVIGPLLAGFGLVAAAALVLWLRHRRQGRLAPIPTGQAFALVASLLGIWLALSSRRFVPVSLILLAPVAAAVLQEVGRSLTSNRLRWSCGAAVLLLLLPIASSLRSSARYYSPEQPFNQGEPFAARMFRLSTYPEGLAAFVRANGIDGRVLNEWGWEGYLRWHCPQLRFYLGARAQQIYREETYLEWQHAMQGSSTRAASSTPPGPVSDGPASQPGQARDLAALLRAHAIGLAVIDLRSPYLSRFAIITSSPGSAWAPVYTDGKAALLVDTATPAGAGLVEMVRSGRAVFADPAVGLYSRAMCNAATVVNGDPRLTLESLVGANRIRPIPAAYQAIGALHGTAAAERSWFRGYLGQEVERLSGAAVDSRPRLDWLLSAREAARALARVCRAEGALEDARTAEERAEETGRTLESLTRRWS